MKKYIFIALLGLYSCSDDQGIIEGNAPKASFTTDKEEYTVGDKVILTNTSEATDSKITSYFWHFGFEGNGNRSEEENTTVTYTSAGKYAVKLTVTDENGLYSTFCDTIVVNPTNMYNPQIQISAESETKRSIFRKRDKTKRSKKESAQHSKSRNKSFVMTSVSAL